MNVRLENLQNGLISGDGFNLLTSKISGSNIIQVQSDQAALQMILSLLYINVIIFVAGGSQVYSSHEGRSRPIEKAHEAQSRFTSDASHDYGTPLTVMKAKLRSCSRQKDRSREARELLESTSKKSRNSFNSPRCCLISHVSPPGGGPQMGRGPTGRGGVDAN